MEAKNREAKNREAESAGTGRHARETIGRGDIAGPRPDRPRGGMRSRPESHLEGKAFTAVFASLTVMIVPLGLYVWYRTQPRRDLERRARTGRAREALARLQV